MMKFLFDHVEDAIWKYEYKPNEWWKKEKGNYIFEVSCASSS